MTTEFKILSPSELKKYKEIGTLACPISLTRLEELSKENSDDHPIAFYISELLKKWIERGNYKFPHNNDTITEELMKKLGINPPTTPSGANIDESDVITI